MTKPKIVYIAGPLNGNVDANVAEAERAAFELARHGVMFYCPHYNAQKHFAFGLPESYWIDMGLEFLRRCDAVMLLKGWVHSIGTIREIHKALRMGLPVFYPNEFNACVKYALGDVCEEDE